MSDKFKQAVSTSLNYLRALFDFTFTRYITIQMLPVLYGVMILASGIAVAQLVANGFSQSNAHGWVYLLLSPFAFIVLVSTFRAILEFLVVTFRIAEDIEKLSGMRESVDKISGMTDLSTLTNRIPFVRLLQSGRRPRDGEEQ